MVVDPAQDTRSGEWRRQDDGLRSAAADAEIAIPLYPRGSYELVTDFTRQSGVGAVRWLLPVGVGQVALRIGAASAKGTAIDDGGEGATAPERVVLNNGAAHRMRAVVQLQGETARVEAFVDDQPIVEWSGLPQQAKVAAKGKPANIHSLAVGSDAAQIVLHRAELKLLDKKAGLVRAMFPQPVVATPPAGRLEANRWIDLLAFIEPWKDAPDQSQWTATVDGLRSQGAQNSTLNVPITPNGSYRLQTAFTRHEGEQSVRYRLPVGARVVDLVLGGDGGATSSLEPINGNRGSQSEARQQPTGIETGHRYQLEVRVALRGQSAAIDIELDGQPYLRWSGLQSALAAADDPRARQFSIGSTDGHTQFHSLMLRLADGYGRYVRTPGIAPEDLYRADWVIAPTGRRFGPGDKLNLLPLIDLDTDVMLGGWSMADGKLQLDEPANACRVAIPVAVRGAYHMQVHLHSAIGNDGMHIGLPVGDHYVLLILAGWGGTTSGLHRIDGADAAGGPTRTTDFTFAADKAYKVDIWVRPKEDQTAHIVAHVDDQPLVDWQGKQSALSVESSFKLYSNRVPAFCGWEKPYTIEAATLDMLDGEGQLLRPNRGS